MVRFQTRLAALLGELPEYATITWNKLEEDTGVTSVTLRKWYEASEGSDQYLNRVDGETLGKLMHHFEVDMDALVVVVDNSPQLIEERTAAAAVAA